jgi:hypothetical protein
VLELLAVPQRGIPYVHSIVKSILMPDYFMFLIYCVFLVRYLFCTKEWNRKLS